MVKESESGCWDRARERRRFGRFATRLPVFARRDDLRIARDSTQPSHYRLELQDFSLGGIRAETPVRLKVNERLTLRLPPNGTHPGMELTGRVKHCRRQEDRYQVGIEFCQTRPEATASPWRQVSRLFSLAFDPTQGGQPVGSRKDS